MENKETKKSVVDNCSCSAVMRLFACTCVIMSLHVTFLFNYECWQ